MIMHLSFFKNFDQTKYFYKVHHSHEIFTMKIGEMDVSFALIFTLEPLFEGSIELCTK